MFSKAAIGQATATLANELLPLGIRVNGIAPGTSSRLLVIRGLLIPLYTGLFQTEMTAAGTADAVGQSHIPEGEKMDFEVPATQPPLAPGERPPYGGSVRDMGSLALFLVGNWFVINGETVLIDGGVRAHNQSTSHDVCVDPLSLDNAAAPIVLLRNQLAYRGETMHAFSPPNVSADTSIINKHARIVATK